MNERDSERMAALLEGMGYEPAESGEAADVVIVNTCSVREKPEHKVFSELGRYRGLKKKRAGMILAVAGCVAQQEGEKLLERVPHLDLVVGTRSIYLLPELVERVAGAKERVCATGMTAADTSDGLFGAERPRPASPTAFVVAMTGCSNFCTYCVVPRLRGPAVSRRPEDILDEVKTLAESGVREVTLLGQNVNIYGSDLPGGRPDFPELLRKVSEVDGICRVRFVTSHPKDFSGRLVDEIAGNPAVCEYLHLPAQAGSDRVLQAMKRGYTRDEYLELVEKIRDRVPDIALSSDFIVGFPGEEEEDFRQTLDLIRTVRYHNIYSFRYSERPNTPASRMRKAVPPGVRAERLRALQALQDRITGEIMKGYEGKTVEVLTEGPAKRGVGLATGRTRSNQPVHVRGDLPAGKPVDVRITRALRHSLRGEVIS